MIMAAKVGKMATNLALSYGAEKLSSGALSVFFNGHVNSMETSENPMIARTGRVLRAITAGYGVGYVAPVAVIAAGQLILGNPMSAVSGVGNAMVLSNPIAATCAAIGAVYYGYNALTKDEKSQFLESLAEGLNIGREFIKSLISYTITTLSDLLSSDMLKQLRGYVVEYATGFGTSISSITKSLSDFVIVGANNAMVTASSVAESVGQRLAATATETGNAASSANEHIGELGNEAKAKLSEFVDTISKLVSRNSETDEKDSTEKDRHRK